MRQTIIITDDSITKYTPMTPPENRMFDNLQTDQSPRIPVPPCWIDRTYIRACLSLIAALIIVSANGCSSAPHSENVKPGDYDYPSVNPQPTEVIKLTVIKPASIKVQLHQQYATHYSGGAIDTGPPCAYIQPLSQARIQYYVKPDLNLRQVGEDTAVGEIVLDRFLQGDCGWGFAGAWYIDDGAPDPVELLVVNNPNSHVANARIDLWCIHNPKRDPKIMQVCSGINTLAFSFADQISAAMAKAIVASGGDNHAPLSVGRSMETIVLQFHDLDAPGGDLALKTN